MKIESDCLSSYRRRSEVFNQIHMMTRMRSISAGSDLDHDHGARAERIVQIERYYELEGHPDDDSIAMVVSPSGKGVIGDRRYDHPK